MRAIVGIRTLECISQLGCFDPTPLPCLDEIFFYGPHQPKNRQQHLTHHVGAVDYDLRTLARRIDGAFPSAVNPVAVWEIKEYYHTTTFGSRVADGVYETLLDGMELEEMRLETGVEVEHILIADAHYTWWTCGRSYLCRMIDMLHMGYVDEILFGTEIEDRLPIMVAQWVRKTRERQEKAKIVRADDTPLL